MTGPVNLGNPHEITVRELAERVIALCGDGAELEKRPLPQDDPVRRCPDITLAQAPAGLGADGAAGGRAAPHGRLLRRPAAAVEHGGLSAAEVISAAGSPAP